MGWIDEHINTVIQGDCLEIMRNIPDNKEWKPLIGGGCTDWKPKVKKGGSNG